MWCLVPWINNLHLEYHGALHKSTVRIAVEHRGILNPYVFCHSFFYDIEKIVIFILANSTIIDYCRI